MAAAFADGEVFGRDLAIMVKAAIADALAPIKAENEALRARCRALEEIAAKPVEIDLAGVQKLIDDEIAKLPEQPKQTDKEEIAALVSEAVAALPPAKDGKSVEIEEVLPVIVAEVKRAVANIPLPKDGKDGSDGRGVKDLLIDRDGQLVATMDDGEMKTLGPVCGKDGADGNDGNDGRDGFSLNDFDVCVLDDDRTIQLKFVSGEHEQIATLKWPNAIYRGVYREGGEYERGDMATWGGSLWHCDEPTKDKPGTDSWTLAAKKGRDGKDAERKNA